MKRNTWPGVLVVGLLLTVIMGCTSLQSGGVQKAQNHALNATVTALYLDGMVAEMHPTADVKMAIDGDPATYAQAFGQYAWTLQVELESDVVVEKLSVFFPVGVYATEFEFSVSKTGEPGDFVKVAESMAGIGNKWLDFEIEPTSCRFVRITAIKPDGPNQKGAQMAVAEFEIYGTKE